MKKLIIIKKNFFDLIKKITIQLIDSYNDNEFWDCEFSVGGLCHIGILTFGISLQVILCGTKMGENHRMQNFFEIHR